MNETPRTDEVFEKGNKGNALSALANMTVLAKALESENTELKKELAILRELVGVRADAPACAADAQHWLKLMARYDQAIKMEQILKEADEILTEMNWNTDHGLLHRIREVVNK